MGRPLIATILSFGFELPLSLGGVALYILLMHGNLLGVYWLQATLGGLEVLVVLVILLRSDFDFWADEARKRQEAGSGSTSGGTEEDEEDVDVEEDVEKADSHENIAGESSEDGDRNGSECN